MPNQAKIHQAGNSSKLKTPSHNTFELLEDVVDFIQDGNCSANDVDIIEEAIPVAGNCPFITDDICSDNDVVVTLVKENLLHNTLSEYPMNRISQNVVLAPSNLAGLTLATEAFEHPILQPIVTPITTTDELLGPDKRKVHSCVGSKNATAASLKSAKVLCKYWRDIPDTDSTVEPETDNDTQHANFADVVKHLATPFDTGKKGKRGRPKKQKSPNNKPGKSHPASPSHGTDYVLTRSKSSTHSHNNNTSPQ